MPGLPLHIVQRGNNRQPCFAQDRDFPVFLDALKEESSRYDVAVNAYVLMTNHVHLLVTPFDETGVSRTMQQLGRRYVSSFNKRYKRSGTLWEGRYYSKHVLSDNQLFACYRYIEMNPVVAGMVEHPGEYPWSSYRTNALGHTSWVITPRTEWIALGPDIGSRCRQYRAMFTSVEEYAM